MEQALDTFRISAMSCELSLTPDGRLQLGGAQSSDTGASASWPKRVANAFAFSQAAGLFALAASKPDSPPSPSVSYWREFSSRYLANLCRTPDVSGNGLLSIDPPSPEELDLLLSGAPPMRGAEYLNGELLLAFWADLNRWIKDELRASGETLGSWLKKHAPVWHQVGRVCFHLAENKRDPDYPFAFLATYAPQVSKDGRVQYQPLSKALQEYAGERNKKALINLLSPVHLASENSALVRELVETKDLFHPLTWTPNEAYRFLKEVPLLEESGVLVRLPDWWRKRPRPRVSVTIGENKQSRLGADSLLDFNVNVVMGDKQLTAEEIREVLAADEGLFYLKGQWIEVDREKLSEALQHWQAIEQTNRTDGISFIDGMRLLAGAPTSMETTGTANGADKQWTFVTAGTWLSDVLSQLRNPSQLTLQTENKDFRGTLRGYQKTGHDWLRFLSSLGMGACLADDMGLGKTVQILSLLLSIKHEGKAPHKPSLLVLPASLLGNWKSEIERFAPTLSARFVHPSETGHLDLGTASNASKETLEGVDVVLTTYGMLLRQSWLLDVEWRLAILDEAQAIKNPSTNQTKAVKQLKSESRIALTGTPVENRLSDLWSLFDFLSPGLLGSAAKFKQFMKHLDERENDKYAPLRNLVSPYILRRLKTDRSIISDLPDKTEVKAFCGLAKRQAALYARTVQELGQALKQVEGIARRGLVLSYLLKLKQICNHPSHFLGDGEFDPSASGKLERLKSICEEIASRQERVLVFTQFREMTGPLANFLSEIFESSGLVLHGGTPVKKRKDLVDSFQSIDGPPYMVLSLKAGGTGLNLTAASHVVHFDRWWNPAVENQATDRAYRIGQHRNVLVHKFICRGTVEEKIDALIEEKTALADGILSGGTERMLTEMTDKELLDIVSLDIERATIGETG